MVPKILIFAVIASIVAVTWGEVSEVPEPIVTPTPNSTTSTAAPTTKPTTSTAAPTTKPTTITTAPTTKPTTSTTAPTTKPTTIPPVPVPTTTSEAPPTTSTSKPTSTPEPPTPTPKPSPKPPKKPDVGKWNVTHNNVTCIMVDMAIQLNVSYLANDNTTKYAIMNVPQNITASGTCGNLTQSLNLTWSENTTKSELNITFTKKENKFMITMITLTVKPDEVVFPDVKNNTIIKLFNNKTEFSTPVSKSYLCEKEQLFDLGEIGSNVTDSKMTVSHVHLEAFHTKKSAGFGEAEDCEPSSSVDVIPIVVGCCLGGLVVLVLIAYLVGRRRAQARGYLSM